MNENPQISKKTVDRLEARESIQQPLFIERFRSWLVFIVLLALLSLLVLWAFLGKIPTEVQGRAVALSSTGTFLLRAKVAGTLHDIFVHEGDTVKEGDPLLKIFNPDIKALLTHTVSEKFKHAQLLTELGLLNHTYEINEELYKKGLIAKIVVQDSRAKLLDKQIEIQASDAALAKLLNDLINASSAPPDRVRALFNDIVGNQKIRDLATVEDDLSVVHSPDAGKILEVFAHINEPLNRKDPLVWIEFPRQGANSEVFYSAVSADITGRVRPGMRVLIEPYNVNPQEYGSIIGKVKEVYPFPVSKAELMRWLENEQIVDYLIGKDKAVVTHVTVEPVLDQRTKSGFKWTSANGPPYTIPTGTVANLKLVIDEQPPISYLIPLWRIKEPLQIKGK